MFFFVFLKLHFVTATSGHWFGVQVGFGDGLGCSGLGGGQGILPLIGCSCFSADYVGHVDLQGKGRLVSELCAGFWSELLNLQTVNTNIVSLSV